MKRADNEIIREMFYREYETGTKSIGIVRGAYFSGYRQCESLALFENNKLKEKIKELESKNGILKSSLSITLQKWVDGEDEEFIENCRNLIK